MRVENNEMLTKERISIIVIGIVILAAGTAYRFFPDIDFSPASGRLKMINKYQNKIVLLPGLQEKQVFLAGETEKKAVRLISASSDVLAGVDVQNMLRELSSRRNIDFISIKTMKPDSRSYRFITVIPVTVAFKASIRQLTDFLYDIETQSKLLSVSELRVIHPGTDKSDQLNIVMTVQGFLITEGRQLKS